MKRLAFIVLMAARGWSLTCGAPIDISDVLICTGVGTDIDDRSVAAVLWIDYALHSEHLNFSLRESGNWDQPQQISSVQTMRDGYFRAPQCRIDPNGVIRTFWSENEYHETKIFTAKRIDDTFTEPTMLWDEDFSKFEIDAFGNVHIYRVVRDIHSTQTQQIEIPTDSQERNLTILHEFEAFHDVEFDEEANIDPRKEICFVSLDEIDGSYERALFATIYDADGVASEPTMIGHLTSSSVRDKVSVDDEKNILVVWQDDGTHILRAAYKPYQKPWTPFIELTTLSKGLSGYILPFEVQNSSGKFFLVWQHEQNGKYFSIHGVAFSTEDQNWSPTMQLSPVGANSFFSSLSLNAKGQGIIAYLTERPEQCQTFLQIAEIDLNK